MGRPHGCIKLIGPRAVPARSGHDGSLTFWFSAHPGVFLRAASRDGSRSDPELDAALGRGCALCACVLSFLLHSMRR